MTVHFAFVYRASVSTWDDKLILVLGAAGGVGLAAIEIGKVLGLTTIIACASTSSKRMLCK